MEESVPSTLKPLLPSTDPMTAPDVRTMHRAARLFLEGDHEPSIQAAERRLGMMAAQVVVGPSVRGSSALQAALLTVVNAGARTFLGGIHVVGVRGMTSATPLAESRNLAASTHGLGGSLLDSARTDLPTILIGADAIAPQGTPLVLRIKVQGWACAISPAAEPSVLNDRSSLALTGILAGAIALSEIFAHELGLHPDAGHRQLGFSLSHPEPDADWRDPEPAHAIGTLPSHLSVIGVGHLGQAYLWAMGSLPRPREHAVQVTLQDADVIGQANLSTCLLASQASIGIRKTRVATTWLECRGFQTRLIERRFERGDRFADSDPRLVLAGVDTLEARYHLAEAARKVQDTLQLIDMGLGSGIGDFDDMILRSSPFSTNDLERWRDGIARHELSLERLRDSAAFARIGAANNLNACGLFQLASTAVGVPFVGAAAGAIAIAEVLRRLATGCETRTLSLSLRDLPLRPTPTIGTPHGAR